MNRIWGTWGDRVCQTLCISAYHVCLVTPQLQTPSAVPPCHGGGLGAAERQPAASVAARSLHACLSSTHQSWASSGAEDAPGIASLPGTRPPICATASQARCSNAQLLCTLCCTLHRVVVFPCLRQAMPRPCNTRWPVVVGRPISACTLFGTGHPWGLPPASPRELLCVCLGAPDAGLVKLLCASPAPSFPEPSRSATAPSSRTMHGRAGCSQRAPCMPMKAHSRLSKTVDRNHERRVNTRTFRHRLTLNVVAGPGSSQLRWLWLEGSRISVDPRSKYTHQEPNR